MSYLHAGVGLKTSQWGLGGVGVGNPAESNIYYETKTRSIDETKPDPRSYAHTIIF